jgi:hypothetical protein
MLGLLTISVPLLLNPEYLAPLIQEPETARNPEPTQLNPEPQNPFT